MVCCLKCVDRFGITSLEDFATVELFKELIVLGIPLLKVVILETAPSQAAIRTAIRSIEGIFSDICRMIGSFNRYSSDRLNQGIEGALVELGLGGAHRSEI